MFDFLLKMKTTTHLFPEISKFVVSEYFRHAWTCLTTPNINDKVDLQLPLMSDCMKNIKGITQIFPELLAMRYFGAFWVCSGMDDNNPTKVT